MKTRHGRRRIPGLSVMDDATEVASEKDPLRSMGGISR